LFPGVEATLDLTNVGALLALTKVARAVSARKLGKVRLARWLKSQGVRKADVLAERIVSAAQAQRHELPAAKAKEPLWLRRSPQRYCGVKNVSPLSKLAWKSW
jgi:hypothetical protein